MQENNIGMLLDRISQSIAIESTHRRGRGWNFSLPDVRERRKHLNGLMSQVSMIGDQLYFDPICDTKYVKSTLSHATVLYTMQFINLELSEDIMALCLLILYGDAYKLHYQSLKFCADAEINSNMKLTCLEPGYSAILQIYKRRPQFATQLIIARYQSKT